MEIKKILGVLVGLASTGANATLIPYTSNGVALVYSSVSDVTWLADANLFDTMETRQIAPSFINSIISDTPYIYDTPNYFDGEYSFPEGNLNPSGRYKVTGYDFLAGGLMTWYGAIAFVNYLNTTNYAGANQWRLPTISDYANQGYSQLDGEIGQLFYKELGGIASQAIPENDYFHSVKFAYWYGSEYLPNPINSSMFYTYDGAQTNDNKTNHLYSWVVAPGQLSEVPLPSALWFLLTGVFSIRLLKFRR
ncbi:DUF1566 domain-containing protein [Methylomonas sp. LW13]|uniref:Lcl domain-containing protein n=1 Tax=unclassified Methylomonas TaxID=2608980 RepID=UPI00051C8277|nr:MULTISPECIES: DUF1566 domain-containing protein [unclassified Methylomonas]PKD40540.1 DUF1566 domain-containing protein [Methylomonas sp. Kb3]QBC28991.1 DUF1566 domain-containing protein [Methylomonas sp. LW13]